MESGSIRKIASQKEAVIYWLTNYPPSRDDDELLVGCIWARVLGDENLDTKTARQFLHLMAERKLPSFDAITRMRRKVQEDMPSLRGTTYIERTKRSKEVQQEIHTI
jgi:hypothetical protein